ncbi:MAG: thiosulfate oxidation carrier complex protein SoxZ [Pseudomonadota bacterium]|jgi:sulfur-oxidizing protein SoxZ
MARALVSVPPRVRPGVAFEVRTMLEHPMESGHRADGAGGTVPRRIVRRFTCRLDGQVVFAAELHPAIAANPYIAFELVAQTSGRLDFNWEGDEGFVHAESAVLRVA